MWNGTSRVGEDVGGRGGVRRTDTDEMLAVVCRWAIIGYYKLPKEKWAKRRSLNPLISLVPRDGIEPPTRGFSVTVS